MTADPAPTPDFAPPMEAINELVPLGPGTTLPNGDVIAPPPVMATMAPVTN